MLNQVVLVGRITRELEIEELENGKKVATLNIAIPRSYKNANGEYETDFIDCRVFDSIATNVKEYCRKGDIVGIKGRLQTATIEKYHTKIQVTEVIAEKVTFLTSKSRNESEE